jgi:hypothetical protein
MEGTEHTMALLLILLIAAGLVSLATRWGVNAEKLPWFVTETIAVRAAVTGALPALAYLAWEVRRAPDPSQLGPADHAPWW